MPCSQAVTLAGGAHNLSALNFVFQYMQGGNKTAENRCEEVTKKNVLIFLLRIIENAPVFLIFRGGLLILVLPPDIVSQATVMSEFNTGGKETVQGSSVPTKPS